MNETTVATSRYYVRCTDCLSIGVVETNPFGNKWKCGVCAGPIEVMGKVVMNDTKLEKTTTRTACDMRCTHAIGPLCVCKCGCVNHGTGRVVTVVIRENIPTIEFQNADEAMKIATDFRNALAVVETALASLSNGYFRPWNVRSLLLKARAARKQDTRLKRIAEASAIVNQYIARNAERALTTPTAAAPIAPAANVAISGNTYPVRDALKKLGGVWNAPLKSWMIPVANADAARLLVNAQPTQQYRAIANAPTFNAPPF